ncbi:MAG: response regulator [Deltaproteobacteria bacterium]
MSIKLLLADDSITIQKVIGIIFGGEDYALTIVDNGKAAVEKASELSPDVLLIDALMPGMTGYEVCEAVRAIPALASKPILLLTGSFEPFDEDKAKKCGADDFLAKPFESQQIVNKVKELAELGASRAVNTGSAEPSDTSEPLEAFAAPAESMTAPDSATPPETSQSTAPSDIWGAFTPEPEPEASAVADVSPEPSDTAFSDFFEPDVFAIVSEESDSQIVQSADAPQATPQHTGTQWVPVEEHTFEFEKENVADIPQAALFDQAIPVQDSAFGEIAFEDGVPAQKVPISKTIIVEPAASDAILPEEEIVSLAEPVAAPVATSVPTVAATVPTEGALSEEQLKAAISAVSKEVIERIVWEVVPDLAETLIREAIRKIREGV